MLARTIVGLLLLGLCSCVEHLEPLPDAGKETCGFDGKTQFFAITGVTAGTSIVVRDDQPARAIVHPDGDIELEGSASAADYAFAIKGVDRETTLGTWPVVRKNADEPGIALQLHIQRAGLGHVELDSFSGEITIVRLAEDELAASFVSTFSSKTDELSGCLAVKLEKP